MNNNRELVLEAEGVIEQLALEVQNISSAKAAEQRAVTTYQSSVELLAQARDIFQVTATKLEDKTSEVVNEMQFVETHIKRVFWISVCAFMFSMSTLVYVLWHLHN